MQWKGLRRSENVEDRRGMRPTLAVGGGLGTLVLIIIVVVMGGDPSALLQDMGGVQSRAPFGPLGQTPGGDASQEELREFVSVILAHTDDVWSELFRRNGAEYVEPKLVLFTEQVESACGFASAAVGPFYCSADSKVYIDLTFYDDLNRRFDAPGDFAQAYVIAHEIGHHVQNLLGISGKVHSMRSRLGEAEANALSVRLELQADFLAGVWAHHAQRAGQLIETGDLEEGLRAAAAIGDDRLQLQGKGYVVPDSFTHGTSEQRVRWFRRGLASGDMRAGDTFAVDEP